MPHGHERTDRLLDEIDDLVQASLVRGDQSGSWQGERYDRCSVASFEHPWHYLPVTEDLEAMRRGSFNTDEFGQGIVDPDYSYNEDESRILCPGSLFLGPPTNDREWEWCVREWGPKRPSQPSPLPDGQRRIPSPIVHRGSRRWRLKPIPGSWDVAVDTEIEFVRPDPQFPYTGRSRLAETILGAVLQTITFKFAPILNPPPEWVQMYLDRIEDMSYSAEGMACKMRDITFEFSSCSVWAEPDESGEVVPTHFDITTHYPIHQHQWWNESWTVLDEEVPANTHCPLTGEENCDHTMHYVVSGMEDHVCCAICRANMPNHHMLHEHGVCEASMQQGHEPDYVIIDEAHEMTNERLRQHVEEAERQYPETHQASDQAQRR